MLHAILPSDKKRRLPFYLAAEEHFARKITADHEPIFFLWQVEPTVIFGRNQVIDKEVDLEYCRENSIQIYRRKSGGGCVFANLDNIMLSYIAPAQSPVATTFAHYTSMVAATLRSLGLNAESSSRNDVTINGKKVSGNAFYHLANSNIVHGTMLFDTDRTHMVRAITPSKSKLESNGVKSVESRITTLREHLDISIDEFKHHLVSSLCHGEYHLSDNDILCIEQIEQSYYRPEWIYGRRNKAGINRRARVENVGEINAEICLNSEGEIANLNFNGDFFLLRDIDSSLINELIGKPYNRSALTETISNINTENIIHRLQPEALVNILID